jgi:hypothetical protein
MYSLDKKMDQPGSGKTRDLREAGENVRKAQDEDIDTQVIDPKKAGNKPRFDRDR